MSTHSTSPIAAHRLGLTIAVLAAACALATPLAAQPSTSLDSCPARQPVLRIAMVSGGESYSSHPAETRFSSTHFTRLHQMPLIGADPKETRIDATYGIAESWSFLPGAKGMVVKLRDGLTFNNGTPITAEDVVFSLELAKAKFADPADLRHARRHRRDRQGARQQDRPVRFRRGLSDLRRRNIDDGLPALRDVQGLSFERRDFAGGVRPLPRQAAGGRSVPCRQPARQGFHHPGRGSPRSVARLPSVRPHRNTRGAGNRHPDEPVPHRTVRHHLRQPRPARPGQGRRSDGLLQARRQHGRTVFLSHLPQGQRVPRRESSPGRGLRHRSQAHRRGGMERRRPQTVGLLLAAIDGNLDQESKVREGMRNAVSLRSKEGARTPDGRRLSAGQGTGDPAGIQRVVSRGAARSPRRCSR